MGLTAVTGPQSVHIGLLGGAFDPPHVAHLALMQAALAQLDIEGLHLLPTGTAWHKPQTLSPAPHRLAMLQLAVADLPRVRIDARELQRAGPSYSVDTLRELRAEAPGVQWTLIIGADQLRQLERWHRIDELLRLTRFAVAWRADPAQAGATDTLHARLAAWQSRGHFSMLDMPASSVSATAIRTLIAQHQAVDHLVCPAVARYIQHNHLYQNH